MITSYSSIQSYATCPRAWWLRDYRKLGPIIDKRTGALGFGSRFHAALEQWGKGLVKDPRDAWRELMAHEYALSAERGGLDYETLQKEDDLGLTMFEGFVDWYETDASEEEFETLEVEHKLSTDLEVFTPAGEPVMVKLYGKLDRMLRHRDSGQYWVQDWKTTRNLEESVKETLESSPQPRIYKALLSKELPDKDIAGIRYTCFRKVLRSGRAKPPFYFHYDLNLSDYNVGQHLVRVSAITGKMVDAVRNLEAGVPAEVAVPFNPTWQCRTCPFRNPCWLMQTVSNEAGEDMLEDEFQIIDPMERYKEEAVEVE